MFKSQNINCIIIKNVIRKLLAIIPKIESKKLASSHIGKCKITTICYPPMKENNPKNFQIHLSLQDTRNYYSYIKFNKDKINKILKM